MLELFALLLKIDYLALEIGKFVCEFLGGLFLLEDEVHEELMCLYFELILLLVLLELEILLCYLIVFYVQVVFDGRNGLCTFFESPDGLFEFKFSVVE